jgi:hypothetical protein
MAIDIITPTAKKQGASEGGGQHWTVDGADVTGLSAVDSGDLVVGEKGGVNEGLVGVALTDYNTNTGQVALDTTGVWYFPIDITSAVNIGDWIYWNGTVLSVSSSNGKPIGQAMAYHAAGTSLEEADIPVKLQPNPVDNRSGSGN